MANYQTVVMVIKTFKLYVPYNGYNVVTWQVFRMFIDEMLGNHNPRHLICGECAIIGLWLPVRIAL
jgi:hypothetical protein